TLKVDGTKSTLGLSASGTAKFKAAGVDVTAQVSFGDSENPGLKIVDGQVTEARVKVTGSFEMMGLTIKVHDVGMTYKKDQNEFAIYGSIGLSTKKIGGVVALDNLTVNLGGGEQEPGIRIVDGSVRNVDIALSGKINLYSLEFQPRNLRLRYDA